MVPGLLSLQLFITAAIGGLIFAVDAIKDWIDSNSWFLIVAIVASFLILFTLVCVPHVMDSYPINLVFLFLFTICEGFVVGAVAGRYDLDEVILAAVITVWISVGLTIFALQTKIDFTIFSGLLFSILLALIMAGVIALLFPDSRTFSLLYSSVAALLFSAYLVYDVQMIAGGRKHELGPDDYIPAALAVYLDILNIFLAILRLFGDG